MSAEAPLVNIEVHHVLKAWAEDRGAQLAGKLGAGSVLVLPEGPGGPLGTMQVILFPRPEGLMNPRD